MPFIYSNRGEQDIAEHSRWSLEKRVGLEMEFKAISDHHPWG